MSDVEFFPILVAGLVSAGIGFAWYHPKVFGSAWMRLSGISPESMERGKKKMPVSAFLALLASMLVAYIMNYFGIAWGVYNVIGAIELGFWCWLGFVAPTMFGTVLWEQKPLRLYFLNALFWLASFVAMANVLLLM